MKASTEMPGVASTWRALTPSDIRQLASGMDCAECDVSGSRRRCLSGRWSAKLHHGLATSSDGTKRCGIWLPTFIQRSIHFFGERTEVWAFNNFVLFDFHLPIMEKRGVGVEQDLLPPRGRLQLHTRIAADSAAFRAFGGTRGST